MTIRRLTVTNIVCNVLAKDILGNYYKLFTVEGDKSIKNPDLYFVVWNSSGLREHATQYSYHSQERDGLVETHVKGMNDVSRRHQPPLHKRDSAIFSILGSVSKDISKLPQVVPSHSDIVLPTKFEYVGICTYVFYTSESGLHKYITDQNFIILHSYPVPTIHTKNINFGVCIDKESLSKIQSES